jgi:predicted enzyme related to lactoylglutathione lyase
MTTLEESEESSSLGPLAHGQLCYLQIPALDIARSAEFYAAVFGWHTDPPGSGFEAPGLIGQWVADRGVAAAAGPLGWIAVDDIDETLRQAAAKGGAALEQPSPDGPVRMLASVSDPAGNTVGVVGHGRSQQ